MQHEPCAFIRADASNKVKGTDEQRRRKLGNKHVLHSFTIPFCFDKLDVCSQFLHQNAYYEIKVCITIVLWGCSKQHDRENNMEERKRGKWQRTKWGRNREGRETEGGREREQMIAWNERGIEGREEKGRSERQR